MNFNLIYNNELYRINMSISSMHRARMKQFFGSKAESIELINASEISKTYFTPYNINISRVLV